MDHVQKIRTCVHCGREFVSDSSHYTNVCSDECRLERRRKLDREKHSVRYNFCTICGKRIMGYKRYCPECKAKHSNVGDPVREYAPVSLEALRKAKTQPRGCSDTRWRMELSRRRLERNCLDAYHLLPDPDHLG